jgi:hypothetical protein
MDLLVSNLDSVVLLLVMMAHMMEMPESNLVTKLQLDLVYMDWLGNQVIQVVETMLDCIPDCNHSHLKVRIQLPLESYHFQLQVTMPHSQE